MKKACYQLLTYLVLIIAVNGCKRPDDENTEDKFLVVTNSGGTAARSLFSTVNSLKDFPTNPRLDLNPYPVVALVKEDLYILDPTGEDILKKYHRFSNGDITLRASLPLLPGAGAVSFMIEREGRGYISLTKMGKVMVFDPGSMAPLEFIDISKYGINDASPDPALMAFSKGRLYVVCNQVYDGKTVPSPAQVLIIDIANGNKIISATDDRAGYAGTTNTPSAAFFTENGDFYLYCVSSRDKMNPRLSGFLRIKNGQVSFDQDYYFSVVDESIAGVEGGKVDYLQRPFYAGNNLVFSTGNIPALAGSPQNYQTDRSFGSFKIDIVNKTISKIKLPYSNGFANSVNAYNGNIYFGLSPVAGAGFYEYNLETGLASSLPRISTAGLGDPWMMGMFY